MTEAASILDEALAGAHLPALLAAMVQLTGQADWLRPEWTPSYSPLARLGPGLPDDVQAEIRTAVKAALVAHGLEAPPVLPTPGPDLLRRMMDFVTGAPIPEAYADFLLDELAITGSTKNPQFDTHGLKAAVRKLKVLVIGAGMSGIL